VIISIFKNNLTKFILFGWWLSFGIGKIWYPTVCLFTIRCLSDPLDIYALSLSVSVPSVQREREGPRLSFLLVYCIAFFSPLACTPALKSIACSSRVGSRKTFLPVYCIRLFFSPVVWKITEKHGVFYPTLPPPL
jgi:hypothetical protein